MLIGRYCDRGRPWLAAVVEITALKVTAFVDFLVDTGADVSMIGPADCHRLGLEPLLYAGAPHVRQASEPVTGIGGEAYPYLVKARLFFPACDSPRVAAQTVSALHVITREMTGLTASLPSVLGWDILGRFGALVLARDKDELRLLTKRERDG